MNTCQNSFQCGKEKGELNNSIALLKSDNEILKTQIKKGIKIMDDYRDMDKAEKQILQDTVNKQYIKILKLKIKVKKLKQKIKQKEKKYENFQRDKRLSAAME